MDEEIIESERLDIDPVINKTCGLSENILYATHISAEETAGIIETLQSLFSEGAISPSTSALINEIDPCLKKTNSNRFYNGDVAQRNIQNMTTIGDNINSLSSSVNELSVDEITSIINQYNEALDELKVDSRKKLLQTAADTFNEKKLEWPGFPKTKTYKSSNGVPAYPAFPGEDEQFNNCVADDPNTEKYDYDVISSETTEQEIKDVDGNVIQIIYGNSIKYQIHKYKQIVYWNFFKCIQSPLDPTFKEIEAMFDKVRCDVPYNRNNTQVKKDPDKGNNWAWN